MRPPSAAGGHGRARSKPGVDEHETPAGGPRHVPRQRRRGNVSTESPATDQGCQRESAPLGASDVVAPVSRSSTLDEANIPVVGECEDDHRRLARRKRGRGDPAARSTPRRPAPRSGCPRSATPRRDRRTGSGRRRRRRTLPTRRRSGARRPRCPSATRRWTASDWPFARGVTGASNTGSGSSSECGPGDEDAGRVRHPDRRAGGGEGHERQSLGGQLEDADRAGEVDEGQRLAIRRVARRAQRQLRPPLRATAMGRADRLGQVDRASASPPPTCHSHSPSPAPVLRIGATERDALAVGRVGRVELEVLVSGQDPPIGAVGALIDEPPAVARRPMSCRPARPRSRARARARR